MALPDCLWWKDAEVCEDIKFAIHVFCMTAKALCDRGNNVEIADRSQTTFIVWKLGAIVSQRKNPLGQIVVGGDKLWWAVEGNFHDSKSEWIEKEAVGHQISFRGCFFKFLERTVPAAVTLLFQDTNKKEMRISIIINRMGSTVWLINLHSAF